MNICKNQFCILLKDIYALCAQGIFKVVPIYFHREHNNTIG